MPIYPEDLPDARGGRSLENMLGSMNWASGGVSDKRPYRPEVFAKEEARQADRSVQLDLYNRLMEEEMETQREENPFAEREMAVRNYEDALSPL